MDAKTKQFIGNGISGSSFIDPEKIISKLKIIPGMKVADFGCGTGYFTFPAAKKVGNNGVVHALDVLSQKVETISSQAKLSGLTNISVSRVNLEKLGGSGLEKDSLDWVFLVNMLFQNKDKKVILEEAKRVLKKGGYILVVEWNEKNESLGPRSDMRFSKKSLEETAGELDLAQVEELEISDWHYGMIFSKFK